nr:piezo-type mechanosensitive ion channel component 1-like [Vicugna pacos]
MGVTPGLRATRSPMGRSGGPAVARVSAVLGGAAGKGAPERPGGRRGRRLGELGPEVSCAAVTEDVKSYEGEKSESEQSTLGVGPQRACLFRFNVLSLVYLLVLLLLPWFPGPSRHSIRGHTGRLLQALLGFSLLFLAAHLTFQICLHTVPRLDQLLGPSCSTWDNISRHIGVTRLDLKDIPNAVRLVAPDLGILVVSSLCLGLCRRLARTAGQSQHALELQDDDSRDMDTSSMGGLQEAPDQPSKRRSWLAARFRITAHWLLVAAGRTLAIVLLALAGIAHPSAFSSVYFLVFLALCTWWACHFPISPLGFSALCVMVGCFGAGHLLCLYCYQTPLVQAVLPPASIWARVFGLKDFVAPTNCSSPHVLVLNTSHDWPVYVSPGILLLLYYTVTSLLKLRARQPPGQRQEAAGRNEEREVELTEVDQWPQGQARAAAAQEEGGTQLTAPPPTRLDPEDNCIVHDLTGHSPVQQHPVRPRLTEPKEPSPLHGLGHLIMDQSYVCALIAMMVWSITYHSWLTFVLLLWACLIWTVRSRHQLAMLCSPFILLYGLALCSLRYVWAMDLQPELPTTLGPVSLRQLGLEHTRYPCLDLGAMLLCTLTFWLLLLGVTGPQAHGQLQHLQQESHRWGWGRNGRGLWGHPISAGGKDTLGSCPRQDAVSGTPLLQQEEEEAPRDEGLGTAGPSQASQAPEASKWGLVAERLLDLAAGFSDVLARVQMFTQRLLELHVVKLVALYTVWVALKEVSVMNFLLVALWAFALPYPRFRPTASCLSTVWTCVIIVCKMLYQLKVVNPHEYSSNCTEPFPNSTNLQKTEVHDSLLYRGPIDPANWFGVRKGFPNLGYIQNHLQILLLLVFEAMVYRRQEHHRRWHQLGPLPAQAVCADGTRQQLDRDLPSCLKYFVNFFFYKFGLEICFLMAVTVIGQRMNFMVILHGCWLVAILTRRRRVAIARLWPNYCLFLALFLLYQYLLCLGVPPALCIDYPWRWSRAVPMNSALIQWLYLPDFFRAPNSTNLISEHLLLEPRHTGGWVPLWTGSVRAGTLLSSPRGTRPRPHRLVQPCSSLAGVFVP